MSKYTCEQINEVAKAIEKESKARTLKRLQILMWCMEGKSYAEVAELSKKSSATIWRICSAYAECGLVGLEAKFKSGHNRKLSLEREAQILIMLQANAEKGCFLRVYDLQMAFEAEAGVKYDDKSFYRLLKRHKWRKVVPKGQHPKKASDEAIDASKKLTQKQESFWMSYQHQISE